MKAYRVILLALLLLLAACSQAPTPTARPDETLSSQAVLAGASGFVFYIVHNPTAAKPYSIVRYDQEADTKIVLYKSDCEIQSVAGTLYWKDTRKVFVSMREPGNCSSDFEIFRITSQTTAEQLTTNSFDDTNVSVTEGDPLCVSGAHSCFDVDYKLVWETQTFCGIFCSKRGIQVKTKTGSTFTDSFIKSNTSDLTQPSISSNGVYITFVRKTGSTQTVVRHNQLRLLNGSIIDVFVDIASNGSGLIKPSFSDPSVSDDGKKVVYLSRGIVAFPEVNYSINLYNSGVISSVVSGAPFSHPHLTSNGNWLSYAQQVNGTYRIKTRSLITNLEADATVPASPISHYAPFWQDYNP